MAIVVYVYILVLKLSASMALERLHERLELIFGHLVCTSQLSQGDLKLGLWHMQLKQAQEFGVLITG